MALPESRQAFEIAETRISGLVNLVLHRHRAWLLGLCSKLYVRQNRAE